MTKHFSPRARKKLFAAAALLACACFAAYALASVAARAQEEEEGEAERALLSEARDERPQVAVHGRAVYEATGRPVRRAQVMLVGQIADGREHAGLTDGEGRFRIRGVRPGRYLAFVNLSGVLSPTGFVGAEELRMGAPDFSRPEMKGLFEEVEVDGKADKEVTVYARRGAALSGKVVYSDGTPAVNLRVQVMRRGDKRLTRFLPGTPAAVVGLTTDDRGVYRVAGLPAGEYVVGVSETAEHADGDVSSPGVSEYVDAQLMQALAGEPLLMTYHPSASRAAEASVVKLDAGDERDDVDITIADRVLRALGGVVRGRRDRRPLANVNVVIVRKPEGDAAQQQQIVSAGYGETAFPNTKTDAEGRWRLKEIPDGQYTLLFTPPDEYVTPDGTPVNMNLNSNVTTNANAAPYEPPRRRKKYAPARRDLRVEADAEELTVELSEGGRVTGTVAVEGADPPEYSGVVFSPVEPVSALISVEQIPSATAFRGRFTAEGLAPGSYRLHVYPAGAKGGDKLYVKSVTWNGRDLMREPLEVTEGASVEGVRILYGRDPARLRVRVLAGGERKPVRAAFVFLVPPDAAGRASNASAAQCFTGDDGSCELTTAPGDYALVALTNTRYERPADFEADLKRRAAAAPRLTLRTAESRTYELTLAEGN